MPLVTEHPLQSIVPLAALGLVAACGGATVVRPVADPLGRPYFRDERTGDFLLTRTLAATREPSLIDGCPGEAYRFIVSSAFTSTELVVRIEHDGAGARVTSTVYWVDSSWGFLELSRTKEDDAEIQASGEVHGRSRTELSAEAWTSFKELLAKADFWNAPERGKIGLDGWNCWIEGRASGRYRRVQRWVPEGAFLDLCNFARKLRPDTAR